MTNRTKRLSLFVGSLSEVGRFVTVGLAATGVYLLLTNLLVRYASLSTAVAASIAFVPVVLMNYILHYGWTFRSERAHSSAVPRFLGTSLGGLIINFLTVYVATHRLGLSGTPSLLFAVGLVVIWNYLLARLWVFISPKVPERDRVTA